MDRRRRDGRVSDWYTISLPVSLGSGELKIGLLSNTGPDPPKNRKATRPEFNVRPSSGRKTPFKWPFTGGPMMAHF